MLKKPIKIMHLAGLVWMIACLLYMTVLILVSLNVQWWVIFSISGYSVLLSLLMISLYLFSIYRGVARSQRIEVEHPLTTSDYYAFFLVIAPFLGALTACFGWTGIPKVSEFLLEISIASLGTSFLAWIIVDPIIGCVEVLSPSGLKHRSARLAEAAAEKQKKQKDREQLLAEVIQEEERNLRHQQELLAPLAERLAELLEVDSEGFECAEEEAVGMGLRAWQIGGLSCMRLLRDMAIAVYRTRFTLSPVNDYISGWWDGIGNWRKPSFD
jgi:hypothetical protein